MKSVIATLVLGLSIVLATASNAMAATYYWNNTGVNLGTLYVRYCDGTTGTLRSVASTSKNVCAFKAFYGQSYRMNVVETGTELFNFKWCYNDKWITFNSSNDSSRHVIARVSNISC